MGVEFARLSPDDRRALAENLRDLTKSNPTK
jgi:uncharacterized membrane protein